MLFLQGHMPNLHFSLVFHLSSARPVYKPPPSRLHWLYQIIPEGRVLYAGARSDESQRGDGGARLVSGPGRPADQPAQCGLPARVRGGPAAAGSGHRPGHRPAVRGGGGGPGPDPRAGHHVPGLRHRLPRGGLPGGHPAHVGSPGAPAAGGGGGQAGGHDLPVRPGPQRPVRPGGRPGPVRDLREHHPPIG